MSNQTTSAINEQDVFMYLVVGLAELSRHGFTPPQPKTFRHALDGLWALALERERGNTFLPSSLLKTLLRFQEPVRMWWPGLLTALPEDIDPDLPLLWDAFAIGQGNIALHDQVLDFLLESDLLHQRGLSLQGIQAVLDQKSIEKLVLWSRDNLEHRQQDYVAIRHFLITHPWTTLAQLRQDLQGVAADRRLVVDMYETTDAFHPLALYQGRYWQCPRCTGILSWVGGRPRCAKRLCGELFPGYEPKAALDPDVPGLLRLKWGIHARVCLPGIPELALFEWLEQIRTTQSALCNVELWPGADRYDLRLTFRDEIWGVDVKDYSRAISLRRKIAGRPLDDAEGIVRYTRGFYVVPAYRAATPGYMSTLADTPFPEGIELLHEDAFREAVEEKLRRS